MKWIFLPFYGMTLMGWAWLLLLALNRFLNPGVSLWQQIKHEAASSEVLWAVLLWVSMAAGVISWLKIAS